MPELFFPIPVAMENSPIFPYHPVRDEEKGLPGGLCITLFSEYLCAPRQGGYHESVPVGQYLIVLTGADPLFTHGKKALSRPFQFRPQRLGCPSRLCGQVDDVLFQVEYVAPCVTMPCCIHPVSVRSNLEAPHHQIRCSGIEHIPDFPLRPDVESAFYPSLSASSAE